MSNVASDTWCQAVLTQQGESRTVSIAGGEVHYLVWGGAAEHRPTLLFVHGMLGHAHWWDVIAPHFVDQYRVLALDLSGMGDSAWREVYDNDTFTRDIVGVIERESDKPVTIIGHSFGGSRSVLACATRPELFNHLIVIDSPCWMISDITPGAAREIGSRIYADRQSALARFRLTPEQPVCAPVLRAHIADHSLRQVSEGWRWKFDPRLGHGDTLLDLAVFDRVRTPMDYVYGERSVIVTPERARRVTSAVRTTRRLVSIPDGHHHLMLDHPVALIATLRELLAG